MRRIFRFELPLDDQPHEVAEGTVVLVAPDRAGNDAVEAWVEVPDPETWVSTGEPSQRLQVFGTGFEIPENALWRGSCAAGTFIWHVYRIVP